mgnify:CR=1 FL=1
MKKFLLLLVALATILPIKAQRHVDELRDDEFRIIIPRHDWTEYMGYKKNSNGELEVNVPAGSLLDIFPKTDVEGDHEFDKSLFIQSAIVDDKIYVGMGSWVITDYINQTSQGYIFEQGAQKMWYGGTNLTTFPFETSGDWYYMAGDGGMCASQWVVDDKGKMYYMTASGAMARTAYIREPRPDKAGQHFYYFVDEHGVWQKQYDTYFPHLEIYEEAI